MHPLKRAVAAEKKAVAETDKLVSELRAAGVSWSRLAEMSGLTVSALRWRMGETRPKQPREPSREGDGYPEPLLALLKHGRDIGGGWTLLRFLDAEQMATVIRGARSTRPFLPQMMTAKAAAQAASKLDVRVDVLVPPPAESRPCAVVGLLFPDPRIAKGDTVRLLHEHGITPGRPDSYSKDDRGHWRLNWRC